MGKTAVDKEIQNLKLAIEEESGASEVMYSVVTEKQNVIISEAKRLFFSFLFFC